MVWARGLVVRAEHEGVGLSRSWFATAEKHGHRDPLRHCSRSNCCMDDDGRVSGVKVTRRRRHVGARTPAPIVLGCGGFEANVQMRTQHIGPLVGAAKVRGTPHNQGDGLRMAMNDRRHALGTMERLPRHADQRRLGRLRAARADRPQQSAELRLRRHDQPQGQALRRRRRGRRAVHLCQVRPRHSGRARRQGLPDLRQPGRPSAGAALLDQRADHCQHAGGPGRRSSTSTTRRRRCKTVDEYNAHAREHADDGFDPTKKDGLSSKGLELEKTNWALRLDKPPFYAYSATGGITFTFGGLKVDENARR